MLQRLLFTLIQCLRQLIACGFLLRQQAVNDQILLRQTDGGQFVIGTRYFFQRCGLCSGDQHHPRQFRIRQCVYGGAILAALFFQPGQRAETGRTVLAVVEITAPCAGQLQHS